MVSLSLSLSLTRTHSLALCLCLCLSLSLSTVHSPPFTVHPSASPQRGCGGRLGRPHMASAGFTLAGSGLQRRLADGGWWMVDGGWRRNGGSRSWRDAQVSAVNMPSLPTKRQERRETETDLTRWRAHVAAPISYVTGILIPSSDNPSLPHLPFPNPPSAIPPLLALFLSSNTLLGYLQGTVETQRTVIKCICTVHRYGRRY